MILKQNTTTRFEFGSDFHLPLSHEVQIASSAESYSTFFAARSAHGFTSGRGALLSLLRHGSQNLGWKRVLYPDYYCPEVIEILEVAGLSALPYQVNPYGSSRPSFDEGDTFLAPDGTTIIPTNSDVLLINNLFGLYGEELRSRARNFPGVVIEDHTHDPVSTWARTSSSDFCFAFI